MSKYIVNIFARILRALPFIIMGVISRDGTVFSMFFACVAALAFWDDTGLVSKS